MSNPQQTGSPGGPDSSSTKDVAKNEASNVGQSAKDAGSQVAGTAADQAKKVTGETKKQAENLLDQAQSQASEQARNAQQTAAESLTSLGQELRTMLEGSEGSGPAHQAVSKLSDGVDSLAHRLQHGEPRDLLDDVRSYARRKPGAFLLGAAVAGVLAGRLTTGVVAAHKDDDSSGGTPSSARRSLGRDNSGAGYRDQYSTAAVPPAPYGTETPYGTEAGYSTQATYGSDEVLVDPLAGQSGTVDPYEDPQRLRGGGLV